MRIQHVNGELEHLRITRDFQHIVYTLSGDGRNAGGRVIPTIIDAIAVFPLTSQTRMNRSQSMAFKAKV